jgi:hypothetical protein
MSADSSERYALLNRLADEFAERYKTKDRHAVFGTGVRARTTSMLASLRVHGIHLTRQRQGQVCHFCHKQ